jgi:hypothetical protein
MPTDAFADPLGRLVRKSGIEQLASHDRMHLHLLAVAISLYARSGIQSERA